MHSAPRSPQRARRPGRRGNRGFPRRLQALSPAERPRPPSTTEVGSWPVLRPRHRRAHGSSGRLPGRQANRSQRSAALPSWGTAFRRSATHTLAAVWPLRPPRRTIHRRMVPGGRCRGWPRRSHVARQPPAIRTLQARRRLRLRLKLRAVRSILLRVEEAIRDEERDGEDGEQVEAFC